GSFKFTVSLTKGASNLTTASLPGTITATPYTSPPVTNTYTVSIAGMINGTVTAAPASAEAGVPITLTIHPDTGYELDAISAFRTGLQTTVVALSGSGATRTFTMPSYNVTVRATFRKTQERLDRDALEAAKEAIEGGTFSVAQATANNAASVRTWLVNTLNALFGQSHNVQFRSTLSIVGDVTVTAITPAIAGTESIPSGTDGDFEFTVTLANGATTLTTGKVKGIIVATPYKRTDTGIESPQTHPLKAWIQNDRLHVSGLIAGKSWSVYNLSGIVVYRGMASSDEADISLPGRGVYIIWSDNKSVKVIR
ncbi:MAG: hypothetical protein LBE79_02805, partial [Tannerella sp.]|nr:hypothetical protein [Tannerella sp.]